jgi:hypothetical protein
LLSTKLKNQTKYVKLIARPDTWFKAGSEAFHEDEYGKRLTLAELEKWATEFHGYIKIENNKVIDAKGAVALRGIRVCIEDYELKLGYKLGEEREDGEVCHLDEFDIEIVEEKN